MRDRVSRSGVRPGQRLTADARVEREAVGYHRLDDSRALHVAQLAPVQITVGLRALRPAEEDVAGGLHHPLSLHHSLAAAAR